MARNASRTSIPGATPLVEWRTMPIALRLARGTSTRWPGETWKRIRETVSKRMTDGRHHRYVKQRTLRHFSFSTHVGILCQERSPWPAAGICREWQ